MSPKSRGRPKGRGRTPAKRAAKVRELSPFDRTLAEARRVAPNLTPLRAQLVGSEWLGGPWAARGMGDRDAEADFVRDVVAATSATAPASRAPAAWTVLHALATIPDAAWRDVVAEALATCPPDLHPWWALPLNREPEQPTAAERWSDPWGDQRVAVLHYVEPEPHQLVAVESRAGGRFVHELIAVAADESLDLLIEDLEREDVPMADILADVALAMEQTDHYWPPQTAPEYAEHRALFRWRTLGHLREFEWEPIPDHDRQRLIAEFSEWQDTELDPQAVEMLADTFIDFGDGYLAGGVLAWSPDEVDRFLLDWAQRKVMLEPEVSAALPQVLEAWVTFALRRAGLDEDDVDAVADRVRELADEYHRLQEDDDAGGPAKQILSRLLEAGVDMSDRAAVDRAIGEYNAEMLAKRMLE